jgi:hypothetical protein
MIPINVAKNFSNTVTATAAPIMLVAAMCIGSGSALADGKNRTHHLSRLNVSKDVQHDHRRFRHRFVPLGYANADPDCRYQQTIDGLIETCPQLHSVFSGGQYVGSDPDARIRGQMLNDFDRGATFPGGR